MDGDLPEVDFIDGGDDGRGKRGVDPAPLSRVVPILLVGVVALLGWIAVFGGGSSTETGAVRDGGTSEVASSPTTPLAAAAPTQPSSPEPPIGTSATVTPTTRPAAEALVRLLPGSAILDGPVVIAEVPQFDHPEVVWIVEPELLRQRVGVPLRPGDWPYLLLVAGGHIAFTQPPDAHLLSADLSSPSEAVVTARYLVPGAAAGTVAAVGQRIESVTPIDMRTGAVGDPVSLGGGVSWVVTGLSDGYLVHPTDEDAYGLYAYWSPEAGLTEIPGLPQRSRFLAAGGRTALFASPGPMIIALDITTGTRLDIDVGGSSAADIGHACISPDGRHAILSDSTGTATIIDVNAQSITATVPTAVDGRSLGWTSNTQAILLNTDRSRVMAFNLSTREATAIAEVNPDTNYWIGGSATQC